MNIFIATALASFLFGAYDVILKLSAINVSPVRGALMVQTASALTIGVTIFLVKINQSDHLPAVNIRGLILTGIAGILIAVALMMLINILQQKSIRASTVLPTVLIMRNLTVVVLSFLLLSEKFTWLKAIGLVISLFGVGLINL